MKIECTPKEVVSKKTDSRGRLNLGTAYADKEVTVLIVETEEEENTGDTE